MRGWRYLLERVNLYCRVLCAGGDSDSLFDGSFCRITHSAVLSVVWGKQAERSTADKCK